MSWLPLAGLGVALFFVTGTAALVVAGRGLSRLQLRAWGDESGLNGATDDAEPTSSEATFAALRLGRQMALLLVGVLTAHEVSTRMPQASLAWTVVLALALYVFFDKILPYALVAALGSLRVLRIGRPLLRLLRGFLGPVARRLVRNRSEARSRSVMDESESERGDLGAFLDLAEEEGLVTASEDALLRGVAEFEDAVVREIMTPRVDMVTIEASATLSDLRKLISEHRFSRIPVIGTDVDDVVGIANLKDLVAEFEQGNEAAEVTRIARAPWFVPETKRVSELLKEFQIRQAQLAIVVDEYGGTAGLVTLEDALEEIVGEIQDEDEPREQLIEVQGNVVVASGKAEIETVEETLGVSVAEGEFHTVGGMIFTHLGHVPETGEKLDCHGLHIEVLEADERRIHRVRITSH